MKDFGILLLIFVGSLEAYAQTVQLKGKVFDDQEKTPLAGANILVNHIQVAVSDKNGEFIINCSDSMFLNVTFVGYSEFQGIYSCTGSGILQIALKPKSNELEPVEVTAVSSLNKWHFQRPASVIYLENRELKRSSGLFLDEAINTNVPGVSMQRRTQSGGQQMNIRGYGNGMGIRGVSGNFDGQGIKMYLNGIPITDAEGITVMEDIDFGSVSSTEILKGPSGVMYGLAIAGVINMKTGQDPKKKISFSQHTMAGSFGLLRSTTQLGIGGEKSSLLVNYGRQQFNGFMPHTRSRKDFANLIGDFHLNDRQTITTYFGYSDGYDERNGELTIAQYEKLDYSGNPKYIQNNAHSAVKTFRAGIGQTYQFNKYITNTTTIFGSSQNMDNSSAGGWTDKLALNYGFRSVFESAFRISERVTISGISGVEFQKMNGQMLGYGMGVDSTNPNGYNIITSLRTNQVITAVTYSYFSEWTIMLPMQFSLSAGLGVSNLKLSLQDRLWGINNNYPGNSKLKNYQAIYNNLLSPAVALNKRLGSIASIYASYATGFKAPVSANVIIPTIGELNTGLKPEKGSQFELGTKGSLFSNKLIYIIAIFHTKYQDKFTSLTVQNPQNTATLYSYVVNGGKLNNNGFEALLSYKAIASKSGLIKLLQPFANFTFSDFKYENYRFERVGKSSTNQDSTIIEDYSGKAVAGVAPVVFNVGVDFDTKIGFYGNVYCNYRSDMPFTSDGLNKTNGYSLLNAKLGIRKRVGHFDFDLNGGANNLTNQQYYQMVFVNQLPDAYIPAPDKITFFGAVNINYTF